MSRTNLIQLLKEAGFIPRELDCDEQCTRKWVRWSRKNLLNLEILHVAPKVYLCDPTQFNKSCAALRDRRKAAAARKSQVAMALNETIREDRKNGLRDSRGRLISGTGPVVGGGPPSP